MKQNKSKKIGKNKLPKNISSKNRPNSGWKKIEMNANLNKILSQGIVYLIIGLLFVPLILNLINGNIKEELSLSELVKDVREEKVERLEIAGPEVRIYYKDLSQRVARKEDGQDLTTILNQSDIDLAAVNVKIRNLSFSEMAWDLFLNIAPIFLAVIVFFFLFRQMRGGAGDIMGIGRSKAKIFIKGKQSTKFANVGGMDEAKKELEEIVDFLKHPKKYKKVGARTPKGVLLVGPSGTGKTLLARAVAGEANVQFLSIAGSEFMEMLVGVGASRARDLFKTAKKLAPAIIFIDEIDAIGRIRGHGSMGGHDEREQTLNQILVEMDGFTQNDNVVVMAATNRGDMLDPALVRPGRFDRRVVVNLPDLKERKFIIKIHAKGKPFAKDVNWDKVSKRTVGFSGADIENMLNEAAIAVAIASKSEISMPDIEEASLKVKLGRSKKRLHDDFERKMTAYHEAGHAVIAHVLPHADPVHRVSIVSRGHALGFTLTPPEKDKVQTTKKDLLDEIAVLLGGRAAEEMIFDEQTAGASNDIQRATKIARAMVIDYGMSDLGPMNFAPQVENSNYRRAVLEPQKISDRLQEKVDNAVTKIVKAGEKQAALLLKKYKKELEKVAEQLLDVETLDSDDFEKLMGMEKAKRMSNS
ncbi:MAG: ATP-dependent zinc metalloprotease FtsH [Patescibacteria group bacterium]